MFFRALLWLIGALLATTTRLSPRMRAQIARDLTITFASLDGSARSFVFRDRMATSRAGDTPDADLRLTFPTTSAGLRNLLAPDAVRLIVEGVSARTLKLEGLPTHLLWFYEMTMAWAPWRRAPHHVLPHSYVAPDPDGRVADRITREAPQAHLDPQWSAAHAQRAKLVMWQVAEGGANAGAIPDYRHVVDVDVPPADTEASPWEAPP